MTGPVNVILVASDGSANARRATQWAADLAAAVGAEIVLVHAVGLLEEPDAASIRTALDGEWAAPVAAAGVPHRTVLEHGPPARVIPDLVRRVGAGMVVLGSRGTGGAPELLLGSTSHQVAQLASVPVVIVPPDDGS